jgi:hypothetical protein
MFEIRCPNCNQEDKEIAADYLRWRSDRRVCPYCKAELVISNGLVCFGVCGFVFGVLIGVSVFWDLQISLTGAVLIVLVCWAILPIFVRAAGRWGIASVGREESVGVQRRSGLVHTSWWVAAISIGITCGCGALYFYRSRWNGPGADEFSINVLHNALKICISASFVIVCASLAVTVFGKILANRKELKKDREPKEGRPTA